MKQLACALQSLLSSSIPLRPHPASSSKAHASHSRIQLAVCAWCRSRKQATTPGATFSGHPRRLKLDIARYGKAQVPTPRKE
uniref:Uncharacterized protein n=1 Tax=Phytophthora fragariae TaxID=53985 RepID=A0A6A3E0X6_9STRA|nr:hypothetical protein PF009_g23937 [Phytophthora fragariae]